MSEPTIPLWRFRVPGVTDPTIACRDCSAGYAGRSVFSRVTLEVAAGETVTIVGPSGCGKSTLLLTLAGLHRPSQGTVLVDGAPLDGPDARIGLVLQQYGLFPWFTVLRNAMLGLAIRAKRSGQSAGSAGAAEAARALLDRLGLGGRESDYPRRLSGGEQQRLALCRTLLLEPEVLLLDEPFSALDALTREELQDLLLGILAERRVAAVLVTHSIDEAVYLGDRVGILAQDPDTGADEPARLLLEANPAGRRGVGRTDPLHHAACVRMRRRFAEAARAEAARA